MKALFMLITVFLFHFQAEAQVCGEGIFTFSFYSLNGTFVKDIHYDFFEVQEDSLNAARARAGGKGSILLRFSGRSFTLNSIDDIVIPEHKTGNTRTDERNKMSGKVKGSKLEVNTQELNHSPILLRITSDGRTQHFIGSFFGGCHGKMNIFLN
ncbi:MAG: hypothetical protein WC716_02665 [Chitinophagaceae bacterium]